MLQVRATEAEWLAIVEEFESKCKFAHCLGALDGKHIAILPPPNSGSLYYNYKRHFSIVLLALVDAQFRFLYVDIGSYGRTSDGGVFKSSSLCQALETNQLHIPPASIITGTDTVCPYVVIADDAFALKPYLMKPYAFRNLTQPQRIFNYRLSRARRVVENAFGQLSQRFRVFGRAIPLVPSKVQVIVMACCCLHNFLLRDKLSRTVYMPDEQSHTAATSHEGLSSLVHQGSNRPSQEAQQVRDMLCSYYSAQGSRDGQEYRSMQL